MMKKPYFKDTDLKEDIKFFKEQARKHKEEVMKKKGEKKPRK